MFWMAMLPPSSLRIEDEGRTVILNTDILPHYSMVSQPTRP